MKVLALRRRRASREIPTSAMFVRTACTEMLAQSDYVVVTAPLTPETRGMIGEPELAAMKPTAVLINIGRGPLVDEAALMVALRESGSAAPRWMYSTKNRCRLAIRSMGLRTCCSRRTRPIIHRTGSNAPCDCSWIISSGTEGASRCDNVVNKKRGY